MVLPTLQGTPSSNEPESTCTGDSSSSFLSDKVERMQQQQHEVIDDEEEEEYFRPLRRSAQANRQIISKHDEVFWIVEEFSTCEEVRKAIEEEAAAKREAEEEAKANEQSMIEQQLKEEGGNDQQDSSNDDDDDDDPQQASSLKDDDLAADKNPFVGYIKPVQSQDPPQTAGSTSKVTNKTLEGGGDNNEGSCAGTVQISISSWDDTDDIVPVRYVYVNNNTQEDEEEDEDDWSISSARAAVVNENRQRKPSQKGKTKEGQHEGWGSGFKIEDFMGAYRQSTFARNMDFITRRGSYFSQNIDYLRRQTENLVVTKNDTNK